LRNLNLDNFPNSSAFSLSFFGIPPPILRFISDLKSINLLNIRFQYFSSGLTLRFVSTLHCFSSINDGSSCKSNILKLNKVNATKTCHYSFSINFLPVLGLQSTPFRPEYKLVDLNIFHSWTKHQYLLSIQKINFRNFCGENVCEIFEWLSFQKLFFSPCNFIPDINILFINDCGILRLHHIKQINSFVQLFKWNNFNVAHFIWFLLFFVIPFAFLKLHYFSKNHFRIVRTFKNLTKSFTSDKTMAISAKSLTKSYIFWFAQAKRDLSVTNVSFVFSWNLCNFPMLGDGHLSLNSFIFSLFILTYHLKKCFFVKIPVSRWNVLWGWIRTFLILSFLSQFCVDFNFLCNFIKNPTVT